MRLRAGFARDAPLVRLALRDKRAHPVSQLRVGTNPKQPRHRQGGVAPAGVRLPTLVHPVPARARILASREEGYALGAVHAFDRFEGGDLGEARDGGVGWGEVRHLPRPAPEPAVGVLAEREKLDDVARRVVAQRLPE